MAKQRLMTPGPTEVPEAALLSMARQVTHHRTPEFRGLLAEVVRRAEIRVPDGKRRAGADQFRHRGDGSGRGQPGAAGGKAIVLESGKFAERWRKIGETFGIEVVRYEVPWGEAFEAGRGRPTARTSIPTRWPSSPRCWKPAPAWATTSRRSAAWSARSKALLVVDGISGVGAMECRTDAWGIDVLVVGARKRP